MNLDQLLSSLETSANMEKVASETGTDKPLVSAELAGILEKKASDDLTKSAFAQGEELARALLEKLANEIQDGNAAMVAADDSKVTSNETEGNVESVLQNTVDKAVASGATTDDRVNHETQVNNVETPNAVEKAASEEIKEDDTMNKSAQENLSLAKQIMEKLAQEFSPEVTTPAASVPVQGALVPNKIQQDQAVMTAQDDAKVQGIVPGGDGTVNALFETIVQKAVAQGGQSDDLINGAPGVQPRSTQGIDGNPETPTGTGGESVEKAAAVSALCEAGMDFDDAIALVKAAEEELMSEAWEDEKRACLEQLMDAGIDFETSIALIKEAEEDLFSGQE